MITKTLNIHYSTDFKGKLLMILFVLLFTSCIPKLIYIAYNLNIGTNRFMLYIFNIIILSICYFAKVQLRLFLCCFWISNLPVISSAQFTNLWTQSINPSSSYEYPWSVTTNASGVYVAGTGNSDWRVEKRDLTTGALIAAFGTAGVVTGGTPGDDYAWTIESDASGIYVGGYYNTGGDWRWRIEKRDLTTGALIAGFGTGGVVSINPSANADQVYDIAVDASGVYLAGMDAAPGASNYEWRIEKRNLTTGAIIWTQNSNPSAAGQEGARAITIDASGIYVAGMDGSLGGTNNEWRIEKRNLTTGALIAGFGTAGVIKSNPSTGQDYVGIGAITIDASGIYIAGMENISGSDYQWRIEKRDLTTGALIAGFGTGGVVNVNPSAGNDQATSITADASGIYVTGLDGSPGDIQWLIEKRDLTTGAFICSQSNNPSASTDYANALIADASGIYVAGIDYSLGGINTQWLIEKYDGTCVVAPVELLYFNAITENNKLVRCEWSTATERNCDYFSIERSNDGSTFWQIGTVNGAGNSNITLNYIFYDHEPYSGTSYYRLKQIDYDGQFEYSLIKQVNIDALNILNIYPNPGSGYIYYTICSREACIVCIKVIDMLGRVLINYKEEIEAGFKEKKLSTVTLCCGSYLLLITNSQQEKIQKYFTVKELSTNIINKK